MVFITPHLTAFVECTVKGFHHFLCVSLWYLYERESCHKFDMADFLSSLNMTVYELHNLSRVEAVVLAEIDKKSLVALLNGSWFSRLPRRSRASRIS